MTYDELESFCQQLLEKYEFLKKDNKKLKNKFDSLLKEKDSFQNKLECISKENDMLKKDNISLTSKLNDLCEENTSLKNKIILVENEKEIALKENNSLKRKIISKEKENISKTKKIDSCHVSHANNVAPSFDKNEIHVLKNRINCLGSTVSQCAFKHNKLESMFRKKQVSHFMHTLHCIHHIHTMLIHITIVHHIPLDHVAQVGSITSIIRVAPRIVLLLFTKGDYSVPYYKSRIKVRNPR